MSFADLGLLILGGATLAVCAPATFAGTTQNFVPLAGSARWHDVANWDNAIFGMPDEIPNSPEHSAIVPPGTAPRVATLDTGALTRVGSLTFANGTSGFSTAMS